MKKLMNTNLYMEMNNMKENYYEICHNANKEIRHNLCHKCTYAIDFIDFVICKYDKDVEEVEI